MRIRILMCKGSEKLALFNDLPAGIGKGCGKNCNFVNLNRPIKGIMNILKRFAAFAMLAALVAACSDNKKEKTDNDYMIEGTIANSEGKTAYLEAPNAVGSWYAIDTVEIADDGSFRIVAPRMSAPEILRLKFDEQYIYIPVDSTETLTINADAKNIGMYEMEGSFNAKTIADISHRITDLRSKMSAQEVVGDTAFKKYLNKIIVGEIQKRDERDDKSGMLSYYIVAVCNVDNVPLYNPLNKSDWRVIHAVANDFIEQRPDDPRTKYLNRVFEQYRQYHRGNAPAATTTSEYEVPVVSLIDFQLPDQANKIQSLSDIATKGDVTLLNFTSYDLPNSSYINNVLKGLYDKYEGKGFEIVQVGVANDPYSWAHGRNGLPWITLYGDALTVGSVLMSYGMVDGDELPKWFLIDRNGELKARIDNVEDLRGAIESVL